MMGFCSFCCYCPFSNFFRLWSNIIFNYTWRLWMVQRTNTTACMIKKNIFKCSQMGHSHSRHINLWTYSFYESSLWRQKTHIKPSQPFNIWENDTPSNFSPLSLELKGSLYVAMRLLWIFLFHKSSLQDLETGYVDFPQICKVVWDLI